MVGCPGADEHGNSEAPDDVQGATEVWWRVLSYQCRWARPWVVHAVCDVYIQLFVDRTQELMVLLQTLRYEHEYVHLSILLLVTVSDQ
jgi:hypothetical protein